MNDPSPRVYPDPDRSGFLTRARLQARQEFDRELFDAAVEEEKAHLRAWSNQSLWQRLINKLPFTITIRRKQP